jgi:hypothetical protein
MELFLSQHYQLRQFIRLQSLSLSHLRSQQILDQIMNECSYLPYLTHLTFTNAHIRMVQSNADRFFNQIWSLKNLTHCYFNSGFDYRNYFPQPTIISTSLKHLIIQNASCTLFTLSHLCQYIPNLQYLSITFTDYSDQFEFSLPILSIIRLKIYFSGSTDILEHLLQNMPYLHHLTFETDNININGYQWEKMIRNYLPKLKIFQFKTSFRVLNDKDKETQLNEIVDTYRTKFWIDEHQWFVRGHLCILDGDDGLDRIDLFTLPYIFDNISLLRINHVLKTSTSSYDGGYLACDRVTHMLYDSLAFRSPSMSHVRFSHLQHLTLSFPLDDQFFSVFSGFDQLTSLYVSVSRNVKLDTLQSQLQFLLYRSPHLRSLSFGIWFSSNLQVPPMEMTSISVRQLYLRGLTCDSEWRCFDDKDCNHLYRSPLGKQCETLSIKVRNRRNILDLVNNMPNLQALNVQCKDDSWTNENDIISSIDDELVEWLRKQLPSSCMITRDTYDIHSIRLWIR